MLLSIQEDLAMPIVEEDIDGLSGLLFPFYDADTHMLYLAGKVRLHPTCIFTVSVWNSHESISAADTRDCSEIFALQSVSSEVVLAKQKWKIFLLFTDLEKFKNANKP